MRRACQTPHATSAAKTGVPVANDTNRKPPTPAPSSAASLAPARARQKTPHTIDCIVNSRRKTGVARNSGPNGYHAWAKTPTSGRPIAAETRYATPHAALSTTGCARYSVALCAARPTTACTARKRSVTRATGVSRPCLIDHRTTAAESVVASRIPPVNPQSRHAP